MLPGCGYPCTNAPEHSQEAIQASGRRAGRGRGGTVLCAKGDVGPMLSSRKGHLPGHVGDPTRKQPLATVRLWPLLIAIHNGHQLSLASGSMGVSAHVHQHPLRRV